MLSPRLATAQRASWQRLRADLRKVLASHETTKTATNRILSAFDALPFAGPRGDLADSSWLPTQAAAF